MAFTNDELKEVIQGVSDMLKNELDKGVKARNEVERLKESIKQYENLKDTYDSEVDRLTSSNSAKDAEIEALKSDLAKLKRINSGLRGQLEEKQTAYNNLMAKYNDMVALVNNKLPGHFSSAGKVERQKKANETRAKISDNKQQAVFNMIDYMCKQKVGVKKFPSGLRLDMAVLCNLAGVEQTFVYDVVKRCNIQVKFFNTNSSAKGMGNN